MVDLVTISTEFKKIQSISHAKNPSVSASFFLPLHTSVYGADFLSPQQTSFPGLNPFIFYLHHKLSQTLGCDCPPVVMQSTSLGSPRLLLRLVGGYEQLSMGQIVCLEHQRFGSLQASLWM